MRSLDATQEQELIGRGFSRRSLGRFAALLAAGTAMPFYNESALAQLSDAGPVPTGAVKIDANENPLGPCCEAAEAIHGIVRQGGRYMFRESAEFAITLAEQEGVPANYVVPFAGSSDPLQRTVMALTSPSKSFVVADPGYEAGARAAQFVGAKSINVPLTKEYAHDVRAMSAADPNAGVIYVCNPNNPTGTATKHEDIEWLVANKPAGAVVLVDEAYIHFTREPSIIPLVAAGKDLIVLRTFSKLYGMAGLRAGAAIGRPDLLDKLRGYGNGMMPITAMAGARASLLAKNLVPQRREALQIVREDVFSFLSKKNIEFIPGGTNCFMLNAKRPGREFMAVMRTENVYVGRIWSAMPQYSRITIGTADEMAKFKVAVAKVMG